jgi:choline dehydrogenase-like flavoprotein
MDRATDVLNLGPNINDDDLWDMIGVKPPQPQIDPAILRSFFWQFARSRVGYLDVMRFGQEFTKFKASNVRVLLNATVCQVNVTPEGNQFQDLEVATIDGARSKVKAKIAVIAASGLENARLLLASNEIHSRGIGNTHDVVGRYLIDHIGARVGSFSMADSSQIAKRFGFYGVRRGTQTHMYMLGLALAPELQEREQLLNASVYMMQQRSPDDPWEALKRLLRGKNVRPIHDVLSVISGAGLLAKGLGIKALSSGSMPDAIQKLIVDTVVRWKPNLAASEFQNRGLPHKLTNVTIDAISEQRPDPNSRISLSDRVDRFGVPMARVNWLVNNDERRTIVRMANLISGAFAEAKLARPVLEPWVAEGRLEDGPFIDMAHTSGTTRMSDNPKTGVVDRDCQVHGVEGLYVAGSSVFPTIGHANPTLMICALSIRLADTIKAKLALPHEVTTSPSLPISNDMVVKRAESVMRFSQYT